VKDRVPLILRSYFSLQYAEAGKVVSVLCQHKDRVNSVRWIRHKDGLPETEFVSASSDCTAVVWTRTDGYNFLPTSILKGHQNAVTVADGIYVSSRTVGSVKQAAVIATASVDSSVKIWIHHENEGIAYDLFNIAPST